MQFNGFQSINFNYLINDHHFHKHFKSMIQLHGAKQIYKQNDHLQSMNFYNNIEKCKQTNKRTDSILLQHSHRNLAFTINLNVYFALVAMSTRCHQFCIGIQNK